MMGIVIQCWCAGIWRNHAQQIQNSQKFSSLNDHRSADSAHLNQHRTRTGTWGLVHKPSCYSAFKLSLRNSAYLCWLCWVAHVPTWVRGFRPFQTLRSGQTGFSKHKIFHKQFKPLHALEGLINTRLGSVSTQDCNASADQAGYGQDWLKLTWKVLCAECLLDPALMRWSAALAACCSIMIDCIQEKPSEVNGKSEGEAKNLNLNSNSAPWPLRFMSIRRSNASKIQNWV